MQSWRWIQDIRGEATFQVLNEFLNLWDKIAAITLREGVSDTHTWHLSSSGQYSAKTTHVALCQGSIKFDPWKRI
jgi:hypothetical protein